MKRLAKWLVKVIYDHGAGYSKIAELDDALVLLLNELELNYNLVREIHIERVSTK